jgi:FkbM family methyltransferase
MYFDIGSNIGRWSLANISSCDKIISVEASPLTFEKLLKNCNGNLNIECINFAVCDNNNNDVIFYEAEGDTLSTLNKDWLTSETSRFYNNKYKEIICKSITFDKLIEKYGIPELIKIDVEGGEFECIKSLTKKVDNLCFEWASETNNITFQCLDYLVTLDYSLFYIQFEDNYTFRPESEKYTDIDTIKIMLNKTIPKDHWGMIWCK